MSSETPLLIDELDTADMLIIDDLHAWQFALNEALLDDADAAAEANQPFASEDILLTIDLVDGRTRRQWQFSYNQIMEAQRQPDGRALGALHEATAVAEARRYGAVLASHDQREEETEISHRLNLLGRKTGADEIADAALFLASGSLASGQTLFIDSGQHLMDQPRDVIWLAREQAAGGAA